MQPASPEVPGVENDAEVDGQVSEAWTTIDRLVDGFLARLPLIAIAAVVFVLFWIVAKGGRYGVERSTRRTNRPLLGVVLGRLFYFFALTLGFLVAVTIVAPSMTPARLVSLLGLGGVALGFAFKDIFQNLLAGVLILLRQPFRIGDEITSGNYTGVVETIETRATHITTYDDQRVVIPNAQIYTQPVAVITAYDRLRSEYDVAISLESDIARACALAMEIMTRTDGVLAEPRPRVLMWDLGGAATTVSSAATLRLWWWTRPDRATVVHVRDAIVRELGARLPAAGIELPFPTQVVHLRPSR